MRDRLLWALAPNDNADLMYLRKVGCRVRRYASIEHADRDTIRADMLACDAALLMADPAANCRAAWLARDMGQPLDLVAVVDSPRHGELMALLQVGVDWIMQQDDPPAMLASALRALRLRRLEYIDDAASPVHGIGPWVLEAECWILRHRDGASLRLSVSERAILTCLFEAPGHVASHDMLDQALFHAWRHVSERASHDPRPSGIISRLRRRGRQAGMDLPLEPLRGYGYVWEI